jgi:hypothetical protein
MLMLSPEQKANREKVEQLKKRKLALYHRVFASTDGKEVLEDLDAVYPETTLRKDEGGRIDEFASIAAAGSREPIIHIKYLVRKADAPTD